VTAQSRLQERNSGADPALDAAPAGVSLVRRTILIFLLILTLVVLARIASSAEGATTAKAPRVSGGGAPPAGALSLRLDEPGGLVAGGSNLQRTVSLAGIRHGSSPIMLGWEARMEGGVAARGGEVLEARGGAARAVLSIPLPALDRPVGLDLRVEVRDGGGIEGAATFPFLLYPKGAGETLASLFGRARVALYDPEGAAAEPLAALGLRPEEFGSPEGLAFFKGDLIVIGPGGFSRGREALGPILAARTRSGMRLLLLEQPTLPGTLSEDLRLWPSFNRTSETGALLSLGHPVLRGLPPPDGASASTGKSPMRPLLPPTRGNFRIISEIRTPTGPTWQEGVTMLELPIGSGTILAAQSSLCADFAAQPGARLLLASSLAYLLGEGRGLKKAFLYGDPPEDVPACLARLAPAATRVPADFAGVEVLLAAGDWRAPHQAAASRLPALADVARYLHEGGTILLLNPQPMSLEYLRDIVGAPVHFETAGRETSATDTASALFEGIAPDDLPLLAHGRQAEFRLRAVGEGQDIEPLLLAPGIAEYRVGRGTLVALSLPDAADCAAPRASSLLARFLTNLGIPLDHAPGLDPDNVSLLDE
jgi:hypothetical protein